MAEKERYGKEADKIFSNLISGDASIKADIISYGIAHPGTISWEEVKALTNNIAASKTPKEYLANKAALWEALKPVYSGALLANQDNEAFRDEIKKQYSQFETEAPSDKLGSHVTLRDLSQDPAVVKYLGSSDEKNSNFIQDNSVWKDGQFVKQEGGSKKATANLNNLTDEQIHYLAQEVYGVEDDEFKQAIADKWAKQQKANKIWNDFQADKETARQRDEYAKEMNSGFGGIAGNAILPTTFEAYTEAVQKGEDPKNIEGTVAADVISNGASLVIPVGLGGKVAKTMVNPYGKAILQNAVTGLADAGIEAGRQVAASNFVDGHEFDGAGALATGVASATVPTVLKSGLGFGEQLGFETGKVAKALKGATIDPADLEKWRIRLNTKNYVKNERKFTNLAQKEKAVKDSENFWNDQLALDNTYFTYWKNPPEFGTPDEFKTWYDLRRKSGDARKAYEKRFSETAAKIDDIESLGRGYGSVAPPKGSNAKLYSVTDPNEKQLADFNVELLGISNDIDRAKLRGLPYGIGVDSDGIKYELGKGTLDHIAKYGRMKERFPAITASLIGQQDSKLAQAGNGLVSAVPRFDVLGTRSGNGLGGSWVGGVATLQGTGNSVFNAGEKQEEKIAKTRENISSSNAKKLLSLYNEAVKGGNIFLADIYKKQLEELAKK